MRYYSSQVNNVTNKDTAALVVNNIVSGESGKTIKSAASSNLNVFYGANTPLFNKLISIFDINNGPINQATQEKIEKLLLNQGLETTKLSSNKSVSSKVVDFLIEIKPRLETLIVNYKNRIISGDPNLSHFNNKIMYKLNNEFLFNIISGRLLLIIYNNNILNNRSRTLEVTIDLGKEITYKYILDCYNNYKLNSPTPHLTFYKWKQENQDLLNEVTDSQIRFELGKILINIMEDLKVIKNIVKVLGREKKKFFFYLVAGPALVKFLPKLETSFIVPIEKDTYQPKEYKWDNGDYLEFGGYLLNGIEYYKIK